MRRGLVIWCVSLFSCILVVGVISWITTHRKYPIYPLEETISDCSWSTQSVDTFNNRQLYPPLDQLLNRVFFTYFKVNYWRDCEIWEDDNQECSVDPSNGGGCQICPCDNDEIPVMWQCEDNGSMTNQGLDELITNLPHKGSNETNERFWSESMGQSLEDLWILHDNSEEYINLRLNPERNTGYGGPHAAKIWRAIYLENCFSGKLEDQCLEERAFYRLVSGIHGSTAVQVAERFNILSAPKKLTGDRKGADRWEFEPNLDFFCSHIGQWPDRATNIYFTWSVLLRAFHKAHEFFELYDFNTGNPEDDRITKQLVTSVLQEGECPTAGFDEKSMFTGGQYKDALKKEFKAKFRNVSRIMDCVACQNCRIHGKLSMLGIASALKVLLDQDEVYLQRNEAIALVNTLYKFSESIRIIELMRNRVFEIFTFRFALGGFLITAVHVLGALFCFGKQPTKQKQN